MNYPHDECLKCLSKFEIRQRNLYESFRESESSIWSSLQVVEESVQTEAVSESVKQENHQNVKISRIWTDSHWCQCFHSFTQYHSCSVYWQYADLREKSQKSETS